jgi:hypothetical protein
VAGTGSYIVYAAAGTTAQQFVVPTSNLNATTLTAVGPQQTFTFNAGGTLIGLDFNPGLLAVQLDELLGQITRPVPFSEHALANARKLLEGILPFREIQRWDAEGKVLVPSRQHPGRVYRIAKPQYDERPIVSVYQDDCHQANLCIHIGDRVPTDDFVVALYLLIRFDEQEVERNANWTFLHIHAEVGPPIVLAEA